MYNLNNDIIIISYIFTEIGLRLTMFSGDILELIFFIAFLILFIDGTADFLYLSGFILEMKYFLTFPFSYHALSFYKETVS